MSCAVTHEILSHHALRVEVENEVIYEVLLRYVPWRYKGKAIPLQTWTGRDVSKRLGLPDFKTIGTWRW